MTTRSALVQVNSGQFFAMDIVERLHRGRRRSKNDGALFLIGAHDRNVSSMIANAITLFKGSIVFLVYDDDTQVSDGREDGRPSTDRQRTSF